MQRKILMWVSGVLLFAVGAALAQTGLKHRTRYGTATLLVGANLPDVDILS